MNVQTAQSRKEAVKPKPRRMGRFRNAIAGMTIGAMILVNTILPMKSLRAEEKPAEEPKPKAAAAFSIGGGYNPLDYSGRVLIGSGTALEYKRFYMNAGAGISAIVADGTSESGASKMDLEYAALSAGFVLVKDKFVVDVFVYRNLRHLAVDVGVGGQLAMKLSKRIRMFAGAEADWQGPVSPIFVGADFQLPEGFKVSTIIIGIPQLDAMGARLKMSKELTERLSFYADLIAICTPATQQMLWADVVSGLAHTF